MRRGTTQRPRVGALLAAGALLVAFSACRNGGEVVGLGETFDPAAAVGVLEDVSAAGDENVAAAHVSLAAGVIAEATAPDEPGASAARRPDGLRVDRAVRGPAGEGRADAPTFASVVRVPLLSPPLAARVEAAAGAGERTPVLPDTLKGKTLALLTIGGYAPLVDRTDAPSDGVRFLTYALDPVTARPKRVPPQQVGHLDIREPPSGGSPRLVLHGVRGGTTELDLFLEGTVSFSEAGFTSDFTSAGSLLDDRRPVEFSLAEQVSLVDGFNRLEISLRRRIEVPSTGRSVELDWLGAATAGEDGTVSVDFTLSIVDGDHSAVLEVTATEATVVGALAYDGRAAAVVSGDPAEPAFSRPDGSPFSTVELDALLELLEGTDTVLGFGDRMLSPLTVLFEE